MNVPDSPGAMSPSSNQKNQKKNMDPPLQHQDIEGELREGGNNNNKDSFDSIDLSDDELNVKFQQPGTVPVVALDDRTAGSYEVVLEDLSRQKRLQQGGYPDGSLDFGGKSPIPTAQYSPNQKPKRTPMGDITNSGSGKKRTSSNKDRDQERLQKESELRAFEEAKESARREQENKEKMEQERIEQERREQERREQEIAHARLSHQQQEEAEARVRMEMEAKEKQRQEMEAEARARALVDAEAAQSNDDSSSSSDGGEDDGDADEFLDASMDIVDHNHETTHSDGHEHTIAPAVPPAPPSQNSGCGIGAGTAGDSTHLDLQAFTKFSVARFDVAGRDTSFMPCDASIGSDLKWQDADHKCEWVRCPDLGLTTLFEASDRGNNSSMTSTNRSCTGGGRLVDVSDINQGALGDCW
jgi:hypothetical protein